MKEIVKIYKELSELKKEQFLKMAKEIETINGKKMITWLCDADIQVKFKKWAKGYKDE